MRWLPQQSPVTPDGSPGDTVLFPWRSGDDALGSTLDEPAPAVTAGSRTTWPVSADLALLLARAVVGALAVLVGVRTLADLPRDTGRSATEALLAAHGFSPVGTLATVLGWTVLAAGVLLAVGVFASFAAGALLATTVAALGVAVPPVLAGAPIATLASPVLATTLVAVLVLAGPGRVSGDAGRPWTRPGVQTPVGLACLVLGVATGITVLFAYR